MNSDDKVSRLKSLLITNFNLFFKEIKEYSKFDDSFINNIMTYEYRYNSILNDSMKGILTSELEETRKNKLIISLLHFIDELSSNGELVKYTPEREIDYSEVIKILEEENLKLRDKILKFEEDKLNESFNKLIRDSYNKFEEKSFSLKENIAKFYKSGEHHSRQNKILDLDIDRAEKRLKIYDFFKNTPVGIIDSDIKNKICESYLKKWLDILNLERNIRSDDVLSKEQGDELIMNKAGALFDEIFYNLQSELNIK